jgi:hypothetical protein
MSAQFHKVFIEGETSADSFVVERVLPERLKSNEITVRGRMIAEILHTAWHAKSGASASDIELKLPSASRQALRLLESGGLGQPQYLLAYRAGDPADRPKEADAQALLRIRTHDPRRLFKKPYPEITDWEALDGSVTGPLARQAAAVL